MERGDALKYTDHYRCRLCGQISPITESLCIKPNCRAQLGIYGELIAVEEIKEAISNPETNVTGGANTGIGGNAKTQPEKKHREHRKENSADTKLEHHVVSKEQTKRWKISTIITVLVIAAMVVGLCISISQTIQWRDDYERVSRNYRYLQKDYDNLKDIYDGWLTFMENNGIKDLYSVKVAQVYNSDKEGNEISKDVKIDTLECLAISIDIQVTDCENRWAEPLKVKLTKSGEEIAEWILNPSEYYDDSTSSLTGWKMWTWGVETAGTYVAEFQHKGYVVQRYEITVE